MSKFLSLVSVGCVAAIGVCGQIKKQFSVEGREHCERIKLILTTKTGNCFIRPSQSPDVLTIYSNQDVEDYSHSFSNEFINKTCFVKLALEQEAQRGVGQQISYQVFGSNERVSDKFWKVYLSESKPYVLDLDYGLGNANIDLSGLAVQQLKIHTGSADVNVFYGSGLENKTEMDTFYVKVDLGSLSVRQLNLARSKVVVADVGFGNILLDYSDRPTLATQVKGSVGAGNLVVILPPDDVPVRVKINDSWLCSLNLCKSLKKVSENTFANDAYVKNTSNALTFDLDVSLGKIIFKDRPN
jgi:hypothetical protein